MPKKLQNQRDPELDAINAVAKLMLEQALERQKHRHKQLKSLDPDAQVAKLRREANNYRVMLAARFNAVLQSKDPKLDPQHETPEVRAAREHAAKRERIAALRAQRAKKDARNARKLERIRRRHRRVKALQLALAMSRIKLRPGGRRRPTPGRRACVIERESGGN